VLSREYKVSQKKLIKLIKGHPGRGSWNLEEESREREGEKGLPLGALEKGAPRKGA